jgi:uncharacterized membrane protein YgcG
MKTSIVKTLIALMLACALLLPAAALGGARYPESAGILTDDANALGQTMAADIAAYADRVESATGLRLHVAVVLFLDGETAQSYADALFTRWSLGEDDLLLLGAAAEDTFAFASGADVKAKISDASLSALLYASGFATDFQNQRYDDAFGAFFMDFNTLLKKQYGETIALGELFAAYQPAAAATAAPTATPASAAQSAEEAAYALWTSTMDSIGDSVQHYRDTRREDENGGGLSTGGWIVLVIIVLIVLGQTGPARRAGRGGCGCSPIGWLFGGLGLGAWLEHRSGGPRRGCCGRPPRR